MTASAPAAMLRPRLAQPAPVRRIDGAILGFAGLVTVSCALAATVAADWIGEDAKPPSVSAVAIGGTTLTLPSDWVRSDATRVRGAERIDLEVPWSALTASREPSAAAHATVAVTLVPADGSMAPADRPRLLYARFAADAIPAGHGGLARRVFRAGSPYEGEELFLAPPDGSAFSARCLPPVAARPVRGLCLAEMRLAGLDVQYRFAPDLLAQWQPMVDGLRRALGSARP